MLLAPNPLIAIWAIPPAPDCLYITARHLGALANRASGDGGARDDTGAESYTVANYERHNRHDAPLVTGGLRPGSVIDPGSQIEDKAGGGTRGSLGMDGGGLVVWSLPGFWSRACNAGAGLQRSAPRWRGFSTVRNLAAQPGGGEKRCRASDDRDGSFERLSLLYQENARVAAAFWEWQHKTLTIFTAGITALLAIEVWIYNNDFGRYIAIPPGAAALLSWLCMRFTERNRAILNKTYKIGKQLEAEIAEGLEQPHEPIFTWLGSHPGTYRQILPRMFKVAVVVFLVVAIAAIIHPPTKAVRPTSIETWLGVVHAPKTFELSFPSSMARPSASGAALSPTAT
jgi:hypothetical protein